MARFSSLLSEKDPVLAQVVERWFDLPEHIKATIKTLVEIQPLLNGANGANSMADDKKQQNQTPILNEKNGCTKGQVQDERQ